MCNTYIKKKNFLSVPTLSTALQWMLSLIFDKKDDAKLIKEAVLSKLVCMLNSKWLQMPSEYPIILNDHYSTPSYEDL